MLLLAAPAPDTFPQAAGRYFEDYYFKFNPTLGTAAGFHQYNTQLKDYSHPSVDRQVAVLKKFRNDFQALSQSDAATGLAGPDAVDLRLIQDDIDARLLAFESIRMWEKNPDTYSSGATNSIFVIIRCTPAR